MPAIHSSERFNRYVVVGSLPSPKPSTPTPPAAILPPPVTLEAPPLPPPPPLPVEPTPVVMAPPEPVEVNIPEPVVVAPPKPKPKPRKQKQPEAEVEAVGDTWFALHRVGESVPALAKLFLEAAAKEKVLFRRLDALGMFSLGRFNFMRMRADSPNLGPVFARLWRHSQLSSVTLGPDGYGVTLPNGRTGKVPTALIYTLPPVVQTTQYQGTKFKGWEQQFG